jgi:hypothetical protein
LDLPQHWLSPDATDLIRRMVVKVREPQPWRPKFRTATRPSVEDPDARLGCRDFRELEEKRNGSY